MEEEEEDTSIDPNESFLTFESQNRFADADGVG